MGWVRNVPKLEVWQVFKLRDLYKCSESDLIKAVEETLLHVGK
jgi:hypothetical protein